MKKNIEIWNNSFTILCSESEISAVDDAQKLLNESIRKIKKQIKTSNRERVLLMAALVTVQTLLLEKNNDDKDYSQLMTKLEDVLK